MSPSVVQLCALMVVLIGSGECLSSLNLTRAKHSLVADVDCDDVLADCGVVYGVVWTGKMEKHPDLARATAAASAKLFPYLLLFARNFLPLRSRIESPADPNPP